MSRRTRVSSHRVFSIITRGARGAQGHVRPAARIPWPGGGRVRRIWDYAKLVGALGLVFLLLLWPAEGAFRRAGGDADVGGLGGAVAVSLSGAAADAHLPGGAARLRAGAGMADAAPLLPARKRSPGAADRPFWPGRPPGRWPWSALRRACRAARRAVWGLMCAGVSPVYLVGGVGAALFGSAAMGLWAGACAGGGGSCCSACCCAGALRRTRSLSPPFPSASARLPCARQWGRCCRCAATWRCSPWRRRWRRSCWAARRVICYCISPTCPPPGPRGANGRALGAAGAVAGFGGLCIAAQNMAVLRQLGVRWRDYLAARGFVAAVCALALQLRFPAPAAEAAMARLETGALGDVHAGGDAAAFAGAAGRGL